MPELPEVETIARTLAPRILGRKVLNVSVLLPKMLQGEAQLFDRIAGSVIRRVHRRAKLLLLTLDCGGASGGGDFSGQPGQTPLRDPLLLAFHLKMTGQFFVHPLGTEPLKHTRIIFDLDDGRLFFDDMRTFGYCRAMRPEDTCNWSFMAGLGPEPLEGTDQDLAGHLLRAFAGRKTAVKAALLDQRTIAGVGNIYADESLFQAGIRPDAKAGELGAEQVFALAKAVRAILNRSIDECGSSIRDYKDANGNAGAFQNSFAVYSRKGAPCTVCASPLLSCRVAGRTTVYCPHCQKT